MIAILVIILQYIIAANVCATSVNVLKYIKQNANKNSMIDLAPTIYRQRLIIEGYPDASVSDEQIKEYLSQLSSKLGMVQLIPAVTHRSDLYGWAGWIHWETSGAHFYAWEQPLLFFSVDIYTCKAFDPQVAIDYTKHYFKATQIVSREA